MFHHSLYFRSDDSSLRYCFCISIALIGSFGDITVYMELTNAISNNIQVCSLPLPPSLSPPHFSQSQVVSFCLSLLYYTFSGSELEGLAHSAAKM